MREGDLSLREKALAFWRVATFRPVLTAFIISFSLFAALLEGIGLSFIVPIVEVIQSPESPADEGGLVGAFATAYATAGIPFTLGYIVVGVGAVMVVRFTSSFIVGWLRVALQTYYVRELQTTAFDRALDARVAYFDRHGSDDVLNAIVTQAEYAGKVIKDFIQLFEKVLLASMYLMIMLYLAPMLTVAALGVLGGLTVLIRRVLEPGYAIGDVVADANERIQESAQAGTQGIREVKLFNRVDDVFEDFVRAVEQFTEASIRLGRNEAAIDNFYNLSAALIVFGLIYAALGVAGLSFGELGLFLFAMFQLAPAVSRVNNKLYKVEGRLPHLVRTQEFIRELEEWQEPDVESGEQPVPTPALPIEFENVSFAYGGVSGSSGDGGNVDEEVSNDGSVGDGVSVSDGGSVGSTESPDIDGGSLPEKTEKEETVLRDVSFAVDRGEFVAFVGQSGAGKSTIVSLLTRLYEPDDGTIRASGVPVDSFALPSWRSRLAVVRQNPFIFNDTLRANVLVGNEDASESTLERVCEIACVTEFLDDLPDGYDTVLGDDGVRLSGGQRQRVSLARALIKDADVLVLDEATSDLDTRIEREVQQGIESMDREYAIVAIAHRLSTVSNADRIYTLEDGEVIESGTHRELVDEDGKYAQLYAMQ